MLDEIKQLDKKYYMNTFGERLNVCFERGRGINLYADDGRVFNDFLGGIAVTALGHSHEGFISSLKKQIDKVIHTSSLYYIENQARLAEKLVQNTCADKVFFANSGAEANEGAMKLAKIYHYKKNSGRYEIITLDHSFHGRTLATVAATGQEKYQKPYYPLLEGVKQVLPNDIEALKKAIGSKTCAVMIELIQGEGGVHPMDREYVKELRRICDENDIILIFDEVQTGMGRCGKLFAYEVYGVEPDIFTSAKALGNGVPIGAVCAKNFVAAAFSPGDHGTTFGGNPLSTAAGLAVFDAFEKEGLVEKCNSMGKYFKHKLMCLKEEHKAVLDVRGEGLLIGIELDEKIARDVFNRLFDKGYLTSLCYTTIRLAPPFVITEKDIDEFTECLDNILKSI